MSPGLFTSNLVNIPSCTSESFGNSQWTNPLLEKISNINHIGLAELGVTSSCQNCSSRMSVLLSHIRKIIDSSAQKKMIRIYTWRIVTPVKNTKISFNWSVMKDPRNPMGKLWSSLSAANANLPVALRVSASCPNPAMFRFFNFIPESVFKSFHVWVYTTKGLKHGF